MASLRLVFPRPGFFLGDVRVVLTLDGNPIYDGGFLAGFDVTVDAPQGPHAIGSVMELGFLSRRREWAIDVPAEGCVATIAYSRFWGNFTRKLKVAAPG